VQEQIDGCIGNRANEFVECIRRSKPDDATKVQLYAVNRKVAWFSRKDIEGIAAPVRTLARSIMRHVISKHRRPNLSRISLRLDSRIATVGPPKAGRKRRPCACQTGAASPSHCTAIRSSTSAAAPSALWCNSARTPTG